MKNSSNIIKHASSPCTQDLVEEEFIFNITVNLDDDSKVCQNKNEVNCNINNNFSEVVKLNQLSQSFRQAKLHNEDLRVELTQSKLGYMFTIEGQNKQIDCLLDSGAYYATMPDSFRKHLKCQKLEKEINLISYNEEAIKTTGIFNVQFYIPGFGFIYLNTIFTEHELAPILGLQFLQKAKASLVYSEKNDNHYILFRQTYERKYLSLSLIDTFTMEANTTCYKRVKLRVAGNCGKLKKGSQVVIEPSPVILPTVGNILSVNNGVIELILLFVNTEENSLKFENLEIQGSLNNKLMQNINHCKVGFHKLDTNKEKLDALNGYIPIFQPLLNEGERVNSTYFDEDVNTDHVDILKYDPPPHPHVGMDKREREALVLEKIEKRNFPSDVNEVLKNSLEALSGFPYDCGKIRKEFDFSFSPDFKRNKKPEPNLWRREN